MGRTILVVLLAMAIAMLPASMSFAGVASTASAVTSAAQAMPDCDHHHHQVPDKQTQKTVDHSSCITGCALCFGFVGAEVSSVAYLVSPSATLKVVRAREAICSLMGSPPFRPPRA